MVSVSENVLGVVNSVVNVSSQGFPGVFNHVAQVGVQHLNLSPTHKVCLVLVPTRLEGHFPLIQILVNF